MHSAYAYYHLQLQLLQSRDPGRRWVLKNSPHLLHLEALRGVLPDAQFVQFHRDPLKVLASNCKLALILRSMMSDHVSPSETGRAMLELLGDYLDGLLRFRAGAEAGTWLDLRFPEFVADPAAAVEGVYQRLGFELTDEAAAGMADWVRTNPRTDLTRAKPADLSPYGIDPDEARERFAPYSRAFGVEFDGI
jgi:hypothetical protein